MTEKWMPELEFQAQKKKAQEYVDHILDRKAKKYAQAYLDYCTDTTGHAKRPETDDVLLTDREHVREAIDRKFDKETKKREADRGIQTNRNR